MRRIPPADVHKGQFLVGGRNPSRITVSWPVKPPRPAGRPVALNFRTVLRSYIFGRGLHVGTPDGCLPAPRQSAGTDVEAGRPWSWTAEWGWCWSAPPDLAQGHVSRARIAPHTECDPVDDDEYVTHPAGDTTPGCDDGVLDGEGATGPDVDFGVTAGGWLPGVDTRRAAGHDRPPVPARVRLARCCVDLRLRHRTHRRIHRLRRRRRGPAATARAGTANATTVTAATASTIKRTEPDPFMPRRRPRPDRGRSPRW